MTEISIDWSTLLATFDATLASVLKEVDAAENFGAFEAALSKGATQLAKALEIIGDSSAVYLEQLPEKKADNGRVLASIISYQWVKEAKNYMILWRNVLLQHQKAVIMELDDKVRKGVVQELGNRSRTVLRKAGEELRELYDHSYQQLRGNAGKKQLKKWSFQHNPWPVYSEQIQQLAAQCRGAEIQQNGLQNTTLGFQKIRQLVKETVQTCQYELQQLRELSLKSIADIEEHIEQKPGLVAARLGDLEKQVKIPPHIDIFIASLKEKIDDLAGKMEVPIDTNGGMVQLKEVNFKKRAQQWLDSEVVPILHEIWELTESAERSMKMWLLNVRNRAVLLSNNLKEGNVNQFEIGHYDQPLKVFMKKIDGWSEEITDLEKVIERRMDDDFRLSAIYDSNKSFLPISLQSTLSQFTLGQNKLLEQAKTQLTKPTSFIRRFRETVNEEENLSPSEKIVRTLQNRGLDANNSQYTSIFQTKGYVGDSFLVGRTQELQRIAALIDQWQLGFRGSAIISGERLSGKTFFGDVIANKYFQKKTIRLRPNKTLNIEGRKQTISYDLKEALNFIKNTVRTNRFFIWIDDLELWQDTAVPLGQNVRSLMNHIDSYNAQFFYMVSISKWLLAHLEKTNGIQRSFQAILTLDKMSLPQIQQAILIRHGATHKILVGEDGEELPTETFDAVSAAVCRSAQRNIGDALNRWSSSIYKLDEDKVIYKSRTDFLLPDFISPNASLLLAAIVKQKRTNEYRLRRLFGLPFKEKYGGILQRLINIGILVRHLDGMLEINDLIANDLGRLLARKNYL